MNKRNFTDAEKKSYGAGYRQALVDNGISDEPKTQNWNEMITSELKFLREEQQQGFRHQFTQMGTLTAILENIQKLLEK